MALKKFRGRMVPMHEYPVTLEIVRIAENTAREKGGLVKAIHLVVGEDSGFIGESIQMYFDVISEGTLCEGALLTIKDIKPKMKCDRCGRLFERKRFSFTCPYCGGDGSPTEVGKEFYIESIDLEVS
ncbi:hydrogenase maturation nickel metallochaperone HypA [uncultured Dialister sp.]|jgi:hydrogenase nickel incorporation protein HypA/HybF|uniref:hydrogenase maturation nickel metallochaperone HypA/HybF n=2 Tax=Dialister TaxID=39948 RepID=UPI0025EC994A|nr:hydrogenase maturation nickel metallochaperone HypA [uncultured Dialister sp.]